MITTQIELTERALQIIAIPEGKKALILDIGCGTGLSGSVLSEHGHMWVGMDISRSMLEVAKMNEVKGDLLQVDIGQGFAFRPGTFDYAISISVIQWLCNADKSCHNPYRRLKAFFQSLYKCLTIGARCCFQFYPDNPEQLDMITNSALENGFTGGLVVDFPHSTKAKKYYLFLQAGYTKESLNEVGKAMDIEKGNNVVDSGDEDENDHVTYNKKRLDTHRRKKTSKKGTKAQFKSKEWILKKKKRKTN